MKLTRKVKQCAASLLILGTLTASANAALLIEIDLSVPNQITVTSTDGLSSATLTGSDSTGIYLENFYGASTGNNALGDTLITGDFTSTANAADNTPDLFRGASSSDPGLNIFSWTPDSVATLTAGSRAFTGSATWTLADAAYNDMINAGPTTGNIYFPADTVDDIAGATVIGEYAVVTPIPEPSSTLLFGLGAFGLILRRRKA